MAQPKNLLHEADVGSGERTPGQKETDKMIEQVSNKDMENNPSKPDPKMHRDQTDSQSGNPP